MCKEVSEQNEQLRARREPEKGKCVVLKRNFAFSTTEVYNIVLEAKNGTKKRKEVKKAKLRTLTYENEKVS